MTFRLATEDLSPAGSGAPDRRRRPRRDHCNDVPGGRPTWARGVPVMSSSHRRCTESPDPRAGWSDTFGAVPSDSSSRLAGFYAVVPAGGAGTRLWPLSRSDHPKFLHDLTGDGRSLL